MGKTNNVMAAQTIVAGQDCPFLLASRPTRKAAAMRVARIIQLTSWLNSVKEFISGTVVFTLFGFPYIHKLGYSAAQH